MSWSDKHEPAPLPRPPIKILGRDPLLLTAFITALITGLATFWLGLTAGAAGAINGTLVALVALWTTRPRTPGLLTGTVAVVVALLAEYGTHWSTAEVTTLNVIVLADLVLLARYQVSPRDTAISRS